MTSRAEYIEGLRELADLLERDTEATLPSGATTGLNNFVFTRSPAEFAATVKAYGGGLKGVDNSGDRFVTGSLKGWKYKIFLLGHTCELVETGEVESYDEVEIVTPAVTRTVSLERPVMERRCPDSLLAQAEDA